MAERWGIRGEKWSEVRDIPGGEVVARGWCGMLSMTGQHRETMTLYRDTGNGWVEVETFPVNMKGQSYRGSEPPAVDHD